jgi:hypothetical protein
MSSKAPAPAEAPGGAEARAAAELEAAEARSSGELAAALHARGYHDAIAPMLELKAPREDIHIPLVGLARAAPAAAAAAAAAALAPPQPPPHTRRAPHAQLRAPSTETGYQ